MSSRQVRTVELQLLRHGPPHNQLLSPLTDYLALCGDHPNTTLNLPLEHEALRVRLRALRYEDSDETRRAQLNETAQIAADVLAAVPGLISDLGRYKDNNDACVHLSIATSAAELALFPFELANSPPGFPGSGGPLCLQSQSPVCLTRRSRNVRCDDVKWNLRPRILLIASDAGGKIPLERHYALLRKLIDPWVCRTPTKEDPQQSSFRDRIEVLPDATVQAIERKLNEAGDRDRFTHVHVLAHGCQVPGSKERFGVALHHSNGSGIDAVDGARLGRLLSPQFASDVITRPNVVTLAVCDSGNQGDVSVPGASIAFELHEADIPLVVGSQFPLTVEGSVVLVETLYSKLLDGCDPREALWETRRALFTRRAEKLPKSRDQGRHDWASMIAFAGFPQDIAHATEKLQQNLRQDRMDIRLDEGDRLLDLWRPKSTGDGEETSLDTEAASHVEHRMEEIEAEVRRFNRWLDVQSGNHDDWLKSRRGISLSGVEAGANKRLAELLHFHGQYANKWREDHQSAVRAFVRKSHRIYSKIAEHDFNAGWAFVQKLFLRVFLTYDERGNQSLLDDWWQAKCICEMVGQRFLGNAKERAWHLTNMIELGLLLHLIRADLNPKDEGFEEKQLHAWCDELDQLATETKAEFAVYAGRRQLFRYPTFACMLIRGGESSLPSSFHQAYRPLWERIENQWWADDEVERTSR